MSRATDYLRKPTERWQTLKAELEVNTFYLVQRFGPTVFSIRNEDGQVNKVVIGDPHKCTCSSNIGQECIHTVFCLLKVLRIPVDNHMAWQTSFTDTEINIVLTGNFQGRVTKAHPKRATKTISTAVKAESIEETGVVRQPLDGEDCCCPICQDQMTLTQPLSWCRKGCGNNIHAKVR